MANPLQMLKLKPTAIQFIHETPVDAPPKKVWAALQKPAHWFFFNPADKGKAKHTFSAQPASAWTAEFPSGNAMHVGSVVYVEPGKLLRVQGTLGLSHLPVSGVVIFELQPESDGKKTLLRVGMRLFGFLDKDVKTRYHGGWKQLSAQLKALAES